MPHAPERQLSSIGAMTTLPLLSTPGSMPTPAAKKWKVFFATMARHIRWARSRRTHSAFTTWQGTFGSGPRTVTTTATPAFPPTGPRTRPPRMMSTRTTRKAWDDLAGQLAAAGINTLTLDLRGFGESDKKLRDAEQGKRRGWPDDVDAALQYLIAQPGVNRDMIGLGGAGWLGVDNSVDAARRHPSEIKSLVLMSGETLRDGLQFLHEARQLPELFVFSDDDEYPPTQDAMKLLYVTASSTRKKLVHYSATQDAPWVWYETSDIAKVP